MSAVGVPSGKMLWSLRARLRVGFVAALLLIIGVSCAAWWVAQEYRRDVNTAYGTQLRNAVQLAGAESALWQLRFGFSEFMIGDAETQRRILAEEEKLYALIEERLAAYAATARDVQEANGLTDLRAAYRRYKESRPRLFELWFAGEKDEAIVWHALTTRPFGMQSVNTFQAQIELQRAVAERSQAQSMRKVRAALFVVAGIAIALLAMLAAGYIYLLRMLHPIRVLRARAVRAVEQRLGVRVALTEGNEIASLVESVDRMSAAFATHAEEIEEKQEALRRLNAELEHRVAERTGELERSLAHVEQQNRNGAMLSELSGLLQSCQSVNEAGEVIGRFCAQVFQRAAGAVYLLSSSRNYLDRLAAWGEPTPAANFPPGECWALRRGRTHRRRGQDIELACVHARPLAEDALCVPLSAQGAALGLLHLEAGAEHGRVAQLMGEQLGLALANLKLRETLRDQSVRDMLTGLHNRRYLEESLEREIAGAKRSAASLAVFMLDVDHFKRFNDEFGHEAGDAVLRAMGHALKAAVRASDLACRFGGEEFTVVLIGSDAATGREWAARFMAGLGHLDVKMPGKILPEITVSIGMAIYPAHGDDPETLLQAADMALYEAKHAGRNRLAAFRAPEAAPSAAPGRQ